MYQFADLMSNLPITSDELASLAGVSKNTLRRMWKGEKVKKVSAMRVLLSLTKIYQDEYQQKEEYTIANVKGINCY